MRPIHRLGAGAIGAIAAAALLLAPMAQKAKADIWNQRTTLTFNRPVEIPGGVLRPGTYVFQVENLNVAHNPNVVQIFNKSQTRLLATEMTIPALRPNITSKTVVTFEERAPNAPEAIHDWYYPGMYYGHQFVYNR